MRPFLPLILSASVFVALPAIAAKPRPRAATSSTHHATPTAHHATVAHATLHHATGSASRSHGHVTHTTAHTAVSMDSERATQIQTALIKNGYLTGEPSGHWDAESIAAMQKLQSDNGWQTKIMPDSRALIKLGLGPGSDPPPPATPPATAAPEPPEPQPHLP